MVVVVVVVVIVMVVMVIVVIVVMVVVVVVVVVVKVVTVVVVEVAKVIRLDSKSVALQGPQTKVLLFLKYENYQHMVQISHCQLVKAIVTLDLYKEKNCISNYDTLPAGVGRMAASGLTRTGNMEMEELGPLMGVASLNPGGYIVYL